MLQLVFRRYELETALQKKEQQSNILREKLPQAKYDLRCAQEELMNYEHGSIRMFLDKLSGKQEEKLELLRTGVRKAESTLKLTQQEREALGRQLTAIKTELASLPDWSEFRAQPGEAGKEAARLEAHLCAAMLIPALDGNYAALTKSRGQLRGERSMEIMTYETLHLIHTDAEQSGERCRVLLQRMKGALDALGIPFEIPAYYRSPTAYTAGVAAKHIRLDRVGKAMDQALEMKNQVTALHQKLEA